MRKIPARSGRIVRNAARKVKCPFTNDSGYRPAYDGAGKVVKGLRNQICAIDLFAYIISLS